jgi:uncharacterized protein (DUF362 family)
LFETARGDLAGAKNERHITIVFMNSSRTTRRNFLGKSIVTGVGIAAGLRAATFGGVARAAGGYSAQVAITKSPDRADNAFRALQMFKKEIAAAIGTKRVVIKVNFVAYPTSNNWAHTRVEHVDGILEFLKSIGKRDVVIAESAAGGNTMAGYDACGYWDLTRKYPVKLMDLNQEGFTYGDTYLYGDSGNPAQRRVRMCKMYLNPNNFIISATPMKTHNTVVVTLSGKNIGMSVPFIDIGFNWSQSGAVREKWWMHGYNGGAPGKYPPGDFQALNDNVYRMLAVYGICPHLAVLDGYQGTEYNGPVSGSGIPTPQQLAVVSLDWLAADRIGLTLMGTNVNVTLNHRLDDGYAMPYPAVLNYCWQAGLGEWDDRKIQVIGDLGEMAGSALVGNANVYNYHSSSNQGSQLGMRVKPRDFVPGQTAFVNQIQES